MIEKWEIIPYPSEKYPDRYKINVKCDYADLKKIADFYGNQCGLPWKSKFADFNFSFYIYKMSPRGVEEFENKVKELQDMAESQQITEEKKHDGFFHPEPRQSVFPPRAAKKQATSEEIKAAKEISEIIDFDVFEPEKLESIEIKKELPSAQKIISVGIIFRSGQDEFSNIISDNLLKSILDKKLKYKIKIGFSKGFLVFSDDDINDAIALCREKNVSSVIVVGELKLAEVLHEAMNSAGIFTEHINTTDVNKKSLYFNIVTNIILSETEKKQLKD